ncbi:MAG: response regulator [Desulfosarcinaceae bacterium]|nr:response regulator [Desulfosarcinaceae bacterium]
MSKVLVIDDEQMVVSLVQQALSQEAFNVDTALAGEDGLRKFKGGNYDLVITDIRMPGTDGHQVVRSIRASERGTTPVIGISGTPWLLKDSAFDRVLPKPFHIQTLIDTARALVPGAN